MQLLVKTYSKSDSGLPVFMEQFDESGAMIMDEDLVINEEIELTEYFEFTVPSLEISLLGSALSQDVKDLFALVGTSTNILGVSFVDGDIAFDGYITEESLEEDYVNGVYFITVINWWKYFYDEMGDHYCPDMSSEVSGESLSIGGWLRKVFLSDIVSSVIVSIDAEYDNTTPYIRMDNYGRYACFMTVREMLDNLHKVLVGAFLIKDGTLTFTQTHRNIATSTNITSLIKDNDYSQLLYYPNEYNSVLVYAAGQDRLLYMDNGSLQQTPILTNGTISDKYNYLDLRQGVTILGDLVQDYFEVSISGNTIISTAVGFAIDEDWEGQALEVLQLQGDIFVRHVGIITNIEQSTGTITIDRWSSDKTPYDWTPSSPSNARIYKLERRKCEYDEEIIKAGTWAMVNGYLVAYPYQTEQMLYRVFNPKGITYCEILGTDISILDRVTINAQTFMVFNASKNIYTGVSSLELEKI